MPKTDTLFLLHLTKRNNRLFLKFKLKLLSIQIIPTNAIRRSDPNRSYKTGIYELSVIIILYSYFHHGNVTIG